MVTDDVCIASSAIQNLQKFDPFADTGDDSTSGSGGVSPPSPFLSHFVFRKTNVDEFYRITFIFVFNNATVVRH
jgi:hypothetical protein